MGAFVTWQNLGIDIYLEKMEEKMVGDSKTGAVDHFFETDFP